VCVLQLPLVLVGWLTAAAVCVAVPRWRAINKATTLAFVAILMPLFVVTVMFDAVFPFFYTKPKCQADVFKNPAKLFKLLQSSPYSGIPKGATLKTILRAGGIDAEPAKERTAMKFAVQYATVAGEERELKVFVKMSTERGVSLLLRAFGSCFLDEHREIAIYKRVADGRLKLPITIPRYVYGSWSRPFHHMLLALELMPTSWVNIPDWQGVSVNHVKAILKPIAELHAKYWRCTEHRKAEVEFMYTGMGLAWLGFIELYVSNKGVPKWYGKLWASVNKYYRTNSQMVMSHGDCRPGNLLFNTADGDAKEIKVVFTDLEAMNLTPYIWDFMYVTVLSLPTETRRASFRTLLELYVSGLHKAGVPKEDVSYEKAEYDYAVMIVAFRYYCWGLTKVGGVGQVQGNSDNDMSCWLDRCTKATEEVRPKRLELAKTFGVDVSEIDLILGDGPWDF
jgi:thiamine kinase-like enzyme